MTAQLSRERLEEIAALEIKTTDAGTRYSPKAYADVRSREIVDMARMLLAGMDSEPVGVPDFDEWSRSCDLSLALCYSDFREKAKYIWSSACAAMLKAGSVTAATVPDGLQAYNSAWPSVSITGSVTPPEVQCYLSKMRLEHIKGDWLGAAIALFGSKRPKVRDELVIRNSIIRNCEMPRGNPLFRDCFLPAEWAGKVNAENCCFDEEFNFQPNADVNWLLLNDEISAPEQEV